MRLVRYGAAGQERPGLIDEDGRVRDLSAHVDDLEGDALGPVELARLSSLDAVNLPLVEGRPRLGPPVARTRKFLAIGLNYRDHAEEAGLPIPAEPIIFAKAVSCIQGAFDPVTIPPDSKKTDWEIELGVVIGSRASFVTKDSAIEHVAGYLIVNDISEREYQLERGGTWDKGKGCDTFGPIGPWLVTRNEIPDVHALDMQLAVNGVERQRGNTSSMIFDVPAIVSYVSQFITLEPGDIIATGTPFGVGMGIRPMPVFLQPDDEMELSIDGLGVQRQRLVAFKR